jgi:hypothetical protein
MSPASSSGSAVIDPRDFGRLEGKVDSIIDRLDRIERVETRVRRLEAWRNYTAGGLALLMAMLGLSHSH